MCVWPCTDREACRAGVPRYARTQNKVHLVLIQLNTSFSRIDLLNFCEILHGNLMEYDMIFLLYLFYKVLHSQLFLGFYYVFFSEFYVLETFRRVV